MKAKTFAVEYCGHNSASPALQFDIFYWGQNRRSSLQRAWGWESRAKADQQIAAVGLKRSREAAPNQKQSVTLSTLGAEPLREAEQSS